MEEKDFKNFLYYDKDTDDLQIYNKEEGEVVEKNFMIDDFIFSFTRKGKLVGLEIRGFSNFLNEYGIEPSILNKIKKAKLQLIPKENSIFIGVDFQIDEKNQIVKKRIPITYLPIQEIPSLSI